MNTHISRNGFEISHSGHVVHIYKKTGSEAFDYELSRAHDLLRFFRASQPGSTWGCDGIGYDIQKKAGLVSVKKSGVGPIKFKQGCNKLAVEYPI